jgi:hypothetical protein
MKSELDRPAAGSLEASAEADEDDDDEESDPVSELRSLLVASKADRNDEKSTDPKE